MKTNPSALRGKRLSPRVKAAEARSSKRYREQMTALYGDSLAQKRAQKIEDMIEGGYSLKEATAYVDDMVSRATARRIMVRKNPPPEPIIKLSDRSTATVGAWSGNVRPWRAYVNTDGKYVGKTGFCATSGRAISAAQEIARRAESRKNPTRPSVRGLRTRRNPRITEGTPIAALQQEVAATLYGLGVMNKKVRFRETSRGGLEVTGLFAWGEEYQRQEHAIEKLAERHGWRYDPGFDSFILWPEKLKPHRSGVEYGWKEELAQRRAERTTRRIPM